MVLVTVCDFARWLGCLSIWGYFRSHFNGFKFTSSSFKQHYLLYHLETDYSITKSFNGWHVKHLPPLRKIKSWCNTDSLTSIAKQRHRFTYDFPATVFCCLTILSLSLFCFQFFRNTKISIESQAAQAHVSRESKRLIHERIMCCVTRY